MSDSDSLVSDQPAPNEPSIAKGDTIVRSIVKRAIDLRGEALHCYLGHGEDARTHRHLHLLLGVPATIIAAAAGATSMTGVQAGANPGSWQNSIWPPVIASILAFAVAVLSALITFLDPKGAAADHFRASSAYQALVIGIEIFYTVDCKKSKNTDKLTERLKELADKLAELNQSTPDLSTWATNRGEELAGDFPPPADG